MAKLGLGLGLLAMCMTVRCWTEWGTQFMATLADNPSLSESCKSRGINMLNHFASDPELVALLAYSGKGVNDLGDYKSCNARVNSTYLALQVSNLPVVVMAGLCVPKECTASDFLILSEPIAQLLNSMFRSNGTSPISRNITASDVAFIDPVKSRADMDLYGTPFAVIISVFILVLALNVVAVCLAYLRPAKDRTGAEKQGWREVVGCFDFVENFKWVFGDSPEAENADLRLMNGFRFGCMLWVILGHTFYYARYSPITNPTAIIDFMKGFWHSYLTNAPFSVDVFFFFSGFLAFYLVLAEVTRCKGRPSLWRLYLHRVLRLAPAYFTLIVSYIWVFPTVVQGPATQHLIDMVHNCRKYVFANFLFVHNFIGREHQCAGWVWYLANDMEYFVLVPIIAMIYYRSKALGGLLLALIATGCMIATMAVAVHLKLSASLMKFNADYFEYYYDKLHTRIFTYLLGILTAMIYIAYKEQQKNWMYSFSVALRKYSLLRWLFYLAACVGMFWLIHAMYWLNKYPDDWSVAEDTIYLAWHKAAFIFCLFFIVYPAMLGRCMVVRKIFGLPFFAALGKLTYLAYLFHPMMIEYHGYRESKGEFFDYDKYLLKFYGYALLAYVVSLVFTPLIACPFRNLSKTYLHAWVHPSYPPSSLLPDVLSPLALQPPLKTADPEELTLMKVNEE